jgi:hypothetical protein
MIFVVTLAQYQNAAAPLIEQVVPADELVAAVPLYAQAHIYPAVRPHTHGAAVMTTTARQLGHQRHIVLRDAGLPGFVWCAIHALGLRDQYLSRPESHAVRVIAELHEHLGLGVGRRQAVHLA